jgi:serine/threonine protein phosphatase PrpC
MKIDYLSIKGTSALNEDAYVINDQQGIYGVIDGVSSLVPYTDEHNRTGGWIAANLVKSYFEQLTDGEDLCRQVGIVNQLMREKMEAAGVEFNKKESLWGAALALVKLHESSIQFVQTGDCMIFAVYANGKIRALTHPQTDHIEQHALKKWADGVRRGIATRAELYQLVKDDLIQNRHRSNQPDGYGVLNGEHAAVDYLEAGRINRANVKQLILLTDGLFMPSAKENVSFPWEETVTPIVENGLHAYADELLHLENSDPECLKYPRFKKSDDKTGMVIRF